MLPLGQTSRNQTLVFYAQTQVGQTKVGKDAHNSQDAEPAAETEATSSGAMGAWRGESLSPQHRSRADVFVEVFGWFLWMVLDEKQVRKWLPTTVLET